MITCNGVNINEIYYRMMQRIMVKDAAVHHRPSRYGDVIEFVDPVATTYRRPWECVLLDPGRNANPFFHFMEALWMLAGRNDVRFVERYAGRMAEFSDDGVTFHGAYGHRWRHHFDVAPLGGIVIRDQLETCVQLLKKDPNDRRAVLTMWDPAADLGRVGKDLPCNTHVYLKVRQDKLIATVCCRSNDMILGAYGSNAVHFAFLQAYVAARLRLPIGELTQISDSLHVYTEPLNGRRFDDYPNPAPIVPYPGTRNLCDDPRSFLHECEEFCDGRELDHKPWLNGIFADTAIPMRRAWDAWKANNVDAALVYADNIFAPDWRAACTAWLERAGAKRTAKESAR